MSDAFSHRGFVFEVDPSIPRATIDGCEVPKEKAEGLFVHLGLPGANTQTLHRLMDDIIKDWPEFIKREVAQRAHLATLQRGAEEWNKWREENPEVRPMLYDTDLSRDTFPANLRGANFANANLINAKLIGKELDGANFHEANLKGAFLNEAILTNANFCRADLYETDLSGATLINANLQGTQLAKTIFKEATIVGCKVYGMSAWDLNLEGAKQKGLIIRYRYRGKDDQTESSVETEITVEDLQVAQFVYLLLSNKNVRNAIDTITSKVVLILGRFTEERKEILDALRVALREENLVPIIFDFAIPTNRDVTETVKVLAGLAKFVVADVTDATEVRAELHDIVPEFPSLPIQPIVLKGKREFVSLLGHLIRLPSVLPTYEYQDIGHLLTNLKKAVIDPAVAKQRALVREYGSRDQA